MTSEPKFKVGDEVSREDGCLLIGTIEDFLPLDCGKVVYLVRHYSGFGLYEEDSLSPWKREKEPSPEPPITREELDLIIRSYMVAFRDPFGACDALNELDAYRKKHGIKL